MSVCERPRFWKVEMRVGTVEFGEGKPFVAACLLAVLLSFLPTCTSQLGPPDFKIPIQKYSNQNDLNGVHLVYMIMISKAEDSYHND